MRAVNTTYALYYNKRYRKVGYVFRNRYKVELIYSERYLINYIHDNPGKAKMCKQMQAYKYSNYCKYKSKEEKIIQASKRKFPEINNLYIGNIYNQVEIDYSLIDYVEDNNLLNKDVIIENFIKNNEMEKQMNLE